MISSTIKPSATTIISTKSKVTPIPTLIIITIAMVAAFTATVAAEAANDKDDTKGDKNTNEDELLSSQGHRELSDVTHRREVTATAALLVLFRTSFVVGPHLNYRS